MRGRWLAAGAAVFVFASGCSLPNQGGNAGSNHVATIVSPSPSPSPTPTQAQVFAVSGPAFHPGEVGVAYTPVVYSASGGVTPYAWTISSGALPPGLTLGGDGAVSGTPTASGAFAFTMQVVDAGPHKADIPVSIKVAPSLSTSLIAACAKYCSVEIGCVNTCGAFGQQTGGVGPFKYSVAQGQLPAGTSLSGLSLTGTFGGLTGYLQFTVQVTDSLGGTDSVSPTFWMYPHIGLASGACNGDYITGCSVQLRISGGTRNDKFAVKLVANNPNPNQGCWNIQAQPPPPGYLLTVNGNMVVVQIPKQIINGYGGVWSLVVTDTALCAPSTYCVTPSATVTIGVQCG